jgi:hypothetical protein
MEINEAFAVQMLAVLAGCGVKLDDVDDRLNVTDPESRWAIRLVPPVCRYSPRCCTSCAVAEVVWR